MPEDSRSARLPRNPVAAAVSPVPAYVFLLAVVVFIIYGSLFPFDFVSPGLPIESFFAEYDVFANRSDALDNFFLFVPLGIGLHLAFRRAAARAAAVLLSILVLAIGVQLLQLYVPSRVSSLSDAFWNTVGMGAGLLAATRVRRAFRVQMSQHAGVSDGFLAGLILLWLLYESFPFVPTLDIGLLREHVKDAVFAPPFELMRLAQHGIAAALAGIAMTRLGALRHPVRGVIALAALSIILEVIVPYGSLRRETLVGIAFGLAAGYVLATRLRARSADAAFALALCAFLITVLTPYRGQGLDPGFTFTPFSHVLWQGALNQLPPSAFEALAIGAMLWAGMAERFRARPVLWSALVLALLAILEWVRVVLAGFHGDTTTFVMALVLAPAAVALRTTGAGPQAYVEEERPEVRRAPARRPALAPLACAWAAITLGMWVLVHLPGIPYNLAKLFGDYPLAGAAVFSLALLWLGGGPWLAARAVLRLDARRRRGALWTPLLVIAIALVSYVLVDLATPAIMLDKIIGAPDLYRRIVEDNYWGEAWRAGLAPWPRGLFSEIERIVRYVALYAAFAIPLVVALLAVPRHDRRARTIVAALCLLPLWLLAKVVVLDWAITDNITELVADGGTVYLAALIVLWAVNAALLVGWRGARTVPVVATALAACAGWWLLNTGIESVVINNGRIFSGVQFLLGENRSALLSAPALFARWCALDAGALAVVVSGVLLTKRLAPAPGDDQITAP